jgi:hypothetical protein
VSCQAAGKRFPETLCMTESEMGVTKHGLWLVGTGSSPALTSMRLAPVCSYCSVHMMLAVAAWEGLHLKQFDIKNVFLHGHLREDVYIWPRKG